jgi:hypothetical protein
MKQHILVHEQRSEDVTDSPLSELAIGVFNSRDPKVFPMTDKCML